MCQKGKNADLGVFRVTSLGICPLLRLGRTYRSNICRIFSNVVVSYTSIISTIMQQLFFFLIAFLILGTRVSFAQTSDFDTKGKDFWIAFPPNFHSNSNSDNITIYITSEVPTTGTIAFSGKPNHTFSITDPKVVYTYQVAYADYELLEGGESEKATKRSFHITTGNEVTVYGLSKATQTSDAFLALPTDVLGNEYYVMAYNSDNSNVSSSDTPSQFAVTATEDATTVSITLPTRVTNSRLGGGKIRQVVLNKGESYLLQANPNSNDDLTGTRITSTKPVAVFGSQKRAAIPYTNSSAARDYLIEEMPTVTKWGYDAYLVPFPGPAGGTGNNNSDLYRILASKNGTVITMNGTRIATLNAGEFYQGNLTTAAAVSASEPILVALYKKSTTPGGGVFGRQYDSDPFMMLVPPAEQFLTSYRWINSQTYVSGGKVYDQQFVNVVAPNSIIATITLDGVSPTQSFIKIPNSGYSYATIPLPDGVHAISADSGIGIYVFGYGNADSYGYIGGMNMVNTSFLNSTVKPVDVSCASGEVVTLPLILDTIAAKPSIQSAGIDHFIATVRFNATLLTPTDESQRGTISNGFQTATLTGKYAGQLSGDTLAVMQLTAGLGDAESTPIEILSFTWLGVAGDTIASKNSVKSAVFRLTDVWTDPTHGVRLINPQEGMMSLSIEPNPTVSLPVTIAFGGEIEPTATLMVYTLMGRQIGDFSRQLRSALPSGGGAGTVQISIPNLAKGVYFVRLASGENSIVRSLLVE